MVDALFIDVSNLNALYKVRSKFVLGTSYAGAPERLLMDAQALGGTFDVYLSLYPRVKGEGDVVIDSLSTPGMEFWALKSEIQAIFGLVEKIPGVGNIYLCNGLVAFLTPARVDNFHTVICYGHRYAHVTVKEKLPTEIKLYASQQDFYNAVGDEYSCYGDIDLIDVDNLRAQFPELEKVKRTTVIPLTSLIMAESCQYKALMEIVNQEIEAYVPEKERKARKKKSSKEAQVVEDPTQLAVQPQPVYVRKRLGERVDWFSAICAMALCACTLVLGFCYQFRDIDHAVESYLGSESSYNSASDYYKYVQTVYTDSWGMAQKVGEFLNYSKKSELDITVSSLSGYTDRVVLQFNCKSTDVKDQFIYYLERHYTVNSVNQYGVLNNTDGTTTYEYGVTVLV